MDVLLERRPDVLPVVLVYQVTKTKVAQCAGDGRGGADCLVRAARF